MPTRRHLIFGDSQIPYHDPAVCGMVVRIAADQRFDVVTHIGDLGDFNSVSIRYGKATANAFADRLSWETKQCHNFLRVLRKKLPGTDLRLHFGNHEARVNEYLETKAPALYSMMQLQKVLRLRSLGIRHFEWGQPDQIGSLLVTHGHIARASFEATAKKMVQVFGRPVVFGHIHKGGAYFERRGGTVTGAWSSFCTCNLDQRYTKAPTDWQQGFLTVLQDRNNFWVTSHPIIDGATAVDGTVYKVRDSDARMFASVKCLKPRTTSP